MSSRVHPLRAERLVELLAGEGPFRRVLVYDSLDSTNDEARRLAVAGAEAGTVVLADAQTAGRGRLGRRWHSPPSLGLYLSVLLRPGHTPEQLTRWTAAAAVAAGEACRAVAGCVVAIKWPNDLLWQGRKLGGVLAEARTGGGQVQELVLGLGVNVMHRTEDLPHELAESATSLLLAAGAAPERELLAAAYLLRLGPLAAALARGEWDDVARRWEGLAPAARGQFVRILHGPGADCTGITEGIDSAGGLRVRTAGGTIRSVHLADGIVAVER